MNPYETDPAKIPPSDLYRDLPLYGRYSPSDQDFQPLSQYCNSSTPAALAYWRDVLKKCDPKCYVYPNPFGGRDVFALGSVIIKSRHLHAKDEIVGEESSRDYSIADANEVAAIQLVKDIITTPVVLFSGKSRIPGVAMNVAWPYLSSEQKASFKQQARNILREIKDVQVPTSIKKPSYIVSDPDPVVNRDIDRGEQEMLFGKGDGEGTLDPLNFAHNDLQPSNIIVKDDKIMGVVDWEHAGWFRFADIAAVHSHFRTPREEDPEVKLDEPVYWDDLYAF